MDMAEEIQLQLKNGLNVEETNCFVNWEHF
jgi:hypothetical protein